MAAFDDLPSAIRALQADLAASQAREATAKAELEVLNKNYISAVNERKEFRDALVETRKNQKGNTMSNWHAMNVEIDYTNWKGERRKRIITPVTLTWGANEFHSGNQWLLLAMDHDDVRSKEFAMKDIHSWKPVLRLTEETP